MLTLFVVLTVNMLTLFVVNFVRCCLLSLSFVRNLLLTNLLRLRFDFDLPETG